MSLLSKDKVKEIRELLAQVNVSDICRSLDVKRRIVYAVLDGESSRYKDLNKVVRQARKVIREMKREQQELQSI